MRKYLFVLIPFALLAQESVESQSMLYQAGEITRRFSSASAKASPPSLSPQTDPLLQLASNWFTIDLSKMRVEKESPLSRLGKEEIWNHLAEIGIKAVELKGLKEENGALTNLKINPKWGSDAEYVKLADAALKRGIQLIGASVGNATGKGADFALALKNYADYPGLYSLVEIAPKDWPTLPKVEPNEFSVNIPWLILQTLHKMGYVPKDYVTYLKESQWNATEPIAGVDGKSRRWIYLRDASGNPRLDWLRPSYASERLAAGDALQNIYRFGQKIIELGQKLPENARADISLAVRKMGGFSAAHVQGGVASFSEQTADLLYDHITPMAAFHALVAEDAEALRLMYRLMLDQNIQPKSMIHALQPFSAASCDWAEFLAYPRKKYKYYEQEMTGEVLRRQLLQEDIFHMTGQPTGDQLNLSTWAGACDSALSFENIDRRRKVATLMHTLIAKLFAWQPGVFCLSSADLMGTISETGSIDLMGHNPRALYPCLSSQMKSSESFAMQLKAILAPRRDYNLERAELIDVPKVKNRSLLILRYRLPTNGFSALLAVNFGRDAALETLDSYEYAETTAVNLFNKLAEEKYFDSSLFELKVDPISAKLILFQPTYYKK